MLPPTFIYLHQINWPSTGRERERRNASFNPFLEESNLRSGISSPTGNSIGFISWHAFSVTTRCRHFWHLSRQDRRIAVSRITIRGMSIKRWSVRVVGSCEAKPIDERPELLLLQIFLFFLFYEYRRGYSFESKFLSLLIFWFNLLSSHRFLIAVNWK